MAKSKKWQQYEDKDAKAREVERRLFDVKLGECVGCGTIGNRCSCDTEYNLNENRKWLKTQVEEDPKIIDRMSGRYKWVIDYEVRVGLYGKHNFNVGTCLHLSAGNRLSLFVGLFETEKSCGSKDCLCLTRIDQ